MVTALEQLDELTKQVAGLQERHIELEARVILLDKVVGVFFTLGRPPTQQELAACSAATMKELAAKYPGLGIAITPAAPPAPKLIVPWMTIRPD